MKQYEIKSFDYFSPSMRKKSEPFAVIHKIKGKDAVFYPMDINGKYCKNDDPEEIIKKANERAMLLEREAYEKGFEQGEKDGLELGDAKAQKIVENLESVFEKINNLRSDILKCYEKEIITLICAVAEKVIDQQVKIDSTIIRRSVINAINMATDKKSIRLKVNPEDFDYIDNLRPDIFQRFNELASVEIISNPSVKRGGCFLETQCGDVDARIETQLSIIGKYLEQAYKENYLD